MMKQYQYTHCPCTILIKTKAVVMNNYWMVIFSTTSLGELKMHPGDAQMVKITKETF